MKVIPRLSIIIVTFNSEKYIEGCILKIVNSKLQGYKKEIFVFDNNSTDSTVKKINNFKNSINGTKVTLIKSPKNIGFSKAVNTVISKNISSYYLLVNPDIIVNKFTIKKVIQCQKKHKAGIVGVKTVDLSRRTNGSYFRFPNLAIGLFDFTNLRKLFGNYWHDYFYYNDLETINIKDGFSVDVITGGFMLIRHEVIKKVGLLDERFFMYLEDVDYCLRASKKKIKTVICDETITHVGGASSTNPDRVLHSAWQMSRKKYFWKNHDIVSNLIIQPIFLFDDLLIFFWKYFKV